MWRSKAHSLLFRLQQQSRLLSRIRLPHSKILVTPPNPPPRARCPLPRFLSTDSSANSVRPDRELGFGEEAGEKAASFDIWSSVDKDSDVGSLIFEDSTSHSGNGGVFVEGEGESSMLEGGFDDSGGIGVEEDLVETAGGLGEIDAEKLDETLSVLRSVEVGSVDSWLEEADIALTEEFTSRVLQDSDFPVDNLIEFFAWGSKRPDFATSSAVVDCFVEKASGSPEITVGGALRLWDLIKEVGEVEKDLVSTKSLNCLIGLFSKLGKGKTVVEVFKKFEEVGCVPDGETYYLTVLALGKPSWAATALDVCEKMVSSKQFPDGDKVGKIIKFFCKGGNVNVAHMVFLAAKEEGISLPSSYVDILIDYLSRNDGTLTVAINMLEEHVERTPESSVKPFACVVSGLCRIKDTAKAKELLEQMLGSGPTPAKRMFNDAFTALAKTGDVKDAISLLKSMKRKGIKPDIRAYNVVMSAYSKGGLMNEACDIFTRAKRDHRKLGRVSYHILSRGYCRIDDFKNALKYMNEMRSEGMLPNVDDYRKMIETLCLKALAWRTAESLLQETKESGLCLDGQTRDLIAAVRELEEEEIESLGELVEA